jgi:NAD(P)-dependent dehydrogenase (short-subunit alcohol dehydrogenase family)
MRRLLGKAAFITGGGTGIGRACARLFVNEGARVGIAGRRHGPLDDVEKEIAAAGGTCLALPCDVTKRQEVEAAMARAEEQFGGLHVVVNNAGAGFVGSADETSDQDWARTIETNLTGVFLVSRAAVGALRRVGGGSIINIGSYLGLVGRQKRAAYCAAKGGVTLLTKAMALDHASENIRVNCICPAIVETDMVKEILERSLKPAATRRERTAEIPMGRMGRPEDIAELALFLASEESAWITGAALPIDGGQTAY